MVSMRALVFGQLSMVFVTVPSVRTKSSETCLGDLLLLAGKLPFNAAACPAAVSHTASLLHVCTSAPSAVKAADCMTLSSSAISNWLSPCKSHILKHEPHAASTPPVTMREITKATVVSCLRRGMVSVACVWRGCTESISSC